jgi:PAS domain-containing protein
VSEMLSVKTITAIGCTPEHLRQISGSVSARGFSLTPSEPEQIVASDLEPEVVLIGPELSDPIRAAQRMHLERPDVGIVILAYRDRIESVRSQLMFAPRIGKGTVVVPLEDAETLATKIAEVATAATARRRHHGNVASAVDLLTHGAPPPRPQARIVLDQLLAAMPIGIAVLDADDRVMLWGRELDELLAPQQDAADSPFLGLVPASQRARVAARIKAAREDPTRRESMRMVAVSSSQDSVHLELTFSALTALQERMIIVAIRDVSAEAQALEAERKSVEMNQVALRLQNQLIVSRHHFARPFRRYARTQDGRTAKRGSGRATGAITSWRPGTTTILDTSDSQRPPRGKRSHQTMASQVSPSEPDSRVG